MKKKLKVDETYLVQHFSLIRHRWATVDEFDNQHYAIQAAKKYEGIMRVVCSNSVASVPVFACVIVKGELVQLW